MSGALEHALDLAARGFWIFPLRENGKKPARKGWQDLATRNPERIAKWFTNHRYNVGIYTGKFGDGTQAVVAIDVDVKGSKHGDQTLLLLDMEGLAFPETLRHGTPTGGSHILYVCDEPLRQGVDVLGEGLDIRSDGGYLVGPGSEIDGKPYIQLEGPALPAAAPAWLVLRLGADRSSGPVDRTPLAGIDPDRAVARALKFLETAPLAIQGEGGDITTFRTACRIKDLGCSEDQTLDLMLEHWNERCTPPWDLEELQAKVHNAFKHGSSPQGAAAPEAIFPPLPAPEVEEGGCDDDRTKGDPALELNQEYAFVSSPGCRVLRETTNPDGDPVLQHLPVTDFHNLLANRKTQIGNGKLVCVSKMWMEDPRRRTFDGLVFSPGKDAGPRWYNLWRGFKVQPDEGKADHPALDMFLEHARENVCQGNEDHFRWLMGWFAHLIQRPWEKPLVALVMKGMKGTGKNALVERVGHLLGRHALVADDPRYFLSNFNGHLEANLLLVLDEAVWSGDKKAEGRLKGLITGTKHIIEKKNLEAFTVDNLTRVVMLSNEKWVCPASQDERRFAVFEVGNGRRQDREFFREMREGMEQGGYSHLLRYLLDFDLASIDVNQAPMTEGLLNQKRESLRGPERFLADAIEAGEIPLRGPNSFQPTLEWGEMGIEVDKAAFFNAYAEASRNLYRDHHAGDKGNFWKAISIVLKAGGVALKTERPRSDGGSARGRVAMFPPLQTAREALDCYLKGA